ncbi:MAG TPA: homocysteine S-methyltransferase family protein [Thermoanaerobaculia bacterium]|nr:homocysteine S-methyltransferase family protein [Thermoanaerobaculia bacterium]
MADTFLDRLKAGPPILLDSAMGSELERRGLELDVPLWSARALVEAPELVAAIHRENADAGADVLTANTFRTTRTALDESGNADRAAELTRLAVGIAREAADAADRPVRVAGSVAPLFDCYRPDLVPEDAIALEVSHAAHVEFLAASGVDLLLLETFGTRREVMAAARAARLSGLPFAASITTDGGGRLLSGEDLAGTADALWKAGAAAVCINCVSSRAIGKDVLRLANAAAGRPFGAYANILSDGDSPGAYADLAAEWLTLGARIVGGCCGTTPDHTRALRARLDAAAA